MSPKSFIIIGDIHGCSDQLEMLLSQSDLFTSRIAVFLGDYVDIGANSRKVLELLILAKDSLPRSIFLSGNHDYEMLRFLNDGDFVRYAKLGGTSTISSYGEKASGDVLKNFRESVPASHIRFLQNLGVCYETDKYLFSHSGFSPSKPEDRSPQTMVLGSYAQILEVGATAPKTIVCGHYFQSSFLPLMRKNIICIDTGCGVLQGPLTALLLPERNYLQVSANLEITHH